MSVHRLANGHYSVRWREGGRHKRVTIPIPGREGEAAAHALDQEIKVDKRLGRETSVTRHRRAPTLRDFIRSDYGPRHASKLESAANVKWLIEQRVNPHLGDYRLTEISPRVVEDWRDKMIRADIGFRVIQQAMGTLSNIFNKAILWELTDRNPVEHVPRPRSPHKGAIRAFSVEQVEAVREAMSIPRKADRLIVSLMAYAGLRPAEAIALTVADIGDRTLTIDKSMKGATKTGNVRNVTLLEPLADELRAYLRAEGRIAGKVFDWTIERPWLDSWATWRKTRYHPAAKAAGLPRLDPRFLRHTFASLLARAQMDVEQIAKQMGHAKTSMTQDQYTHLIEEYRGAEPFSVEEEIRKVRAA